MRGQWSVQLFQAAYFTVWLEASVRCQAKEAEAASLKRIHHHVTACTETLGTEAIIPMHRLPPASHLSMVSHYGNRTGDYNGEAQKAAQNLWRMPGRLYPPRPGAVPRPALQIGRASCRERV